MPKVTIVDRVLAATVLRFFTKKITPNQITIFRFLAIPFVAVLLILERYGIGIVLFSLAAFSDALDGAMARTRDQVTEWGKLYDPLADKLLIGAVTIITLPQFVNLFVVFGIVFIEMLLIGSSYYFKNRLGSTIQANFWGKWKMIAQSFGVGLVLLFALTAAPAVLTAAYVLLYAAIALAIVSVITYSI